MLDGVPRAVLGERGERQRNHLAHSSRSRSRRTGTLRPLPSPRGSLARARRQGRGRPLRPQLSAPRALRVWGPLGMCVSSELAGDSSEAERSPGVVWRTLPGLSAWWGVRVSAWKHPARCPLSPGVSPGQRSCPPGGVAFVRACRLPRGSAVPSSAPQDALGFPVLTRQRRGLGHRWPPCPLIWREGCNLPTGGAARCSLPWPGVFRGPHSGQGKKP